MSNESSRRDFLRAAGLVAGGAVLSGAVLGDPARALLGDPARGVLGDPARDGIAAGPPSLAPSPWDQVPAILARVKPPTFPARDFDITAYGAKGDGRTDCTAAFRRAVAACHDAGGGRVVVPPGNFSTGAIHLRSNVNLHVGSGAVITFSSDPGKYLPIVYTRWQGIECYNYSPFIYAHGQINVAVTGAGTLEGQGASWKPFGGGGADWRELQEMAVDNVPVAQRRFGDGHRLRPNMIQFYRCRNILVEGVTINRPPMWTIHPVLSENITVRNVTVNSRNGGGNNDGCDPECCTDVHITGCTFDTGDDCIAIKSGRDVEGRRIGVPSQNIVIENSTFVFSNRGAICIGSEASGGARNIFAQNCRVNPANRADAFWYVLFIKTSNRRGGTTDGVHLRNITANKLVKAGVFITMNYSGSGNSGPVSNPVIQNVDVDGMTARGIKAYAVDLDGLSGHPMRRISIRNSTFTQVENDEPRIRNAREVTFTNVRINGDPV